MSITARDIVDTCTGLSGYASLYREQIRMNSDGSGHVKVQAAQLARMCAFIDEVVSELTQLVPNVAPVIDDE